MLSVLEETVNKGDVIVGDVVAETVVVSAGVVVTVVVSETVVTEEVSDVPEAVSVTVTVPVPVSGAVPFTVKLKNTTCILPIFIPQGKLSVLLQRIVYLLSPLPP